MGLSGSKPKLPYLIGVREDASTTEDSMEDTTDIEFARRYNKLIDSLPNQPLAYREYIESGRLSSAVGYSEQEERKQAAFITDENIRNKITYILGKYSQLVAGIETDINTECNIQGFCPRHVISEDGTKRPIESLDRIHPCQNRACMKEQLQSLLTKYKRWMNTGMWAGDTAKPKSEPENVMITRAGLIEILERLQQSVLSNIELASVDHTTDVIQDSKQSEGKLTTIIGPLLSAKLLAIIIIAVIIILVVVVVAPSVVVTPAAATDKK